LLVSLGIILVFAMILSIRLSHEGQTDVTRENEGTHVSQYVHKSPDGDALDRQSAPEPDQTAAPDDGAGSSTASHDSGGADHETGPAPSGADLAALGPRDEERGLLVAGRNAPPTAGDASHPAGGAVEPDAGTRQADPPPAQPAEQPYTVEQGDSLYVIAEKVFGAGQGPKWPLIAKANPGLEASKLKPGMKLVIPVIPQRANTAPSAPEGQRQTPTAGRTYVVAAGDTLGGISSKMYGTSKKWKLIQAANKNVDPGSLKVGMTLTIPQVESAPPAPPSPVTPLPVHANTGPTSPSPASPDTVVPGSGGSLERALDQVRQFVADRPARAATPYSTYRVMPNDTLIGISRKVYNTDNRWREIYELNRDKLSRPSARVVGQTLRLPATTETAMADTGDRVR
jgi:nucleoid-associated protein YgaU